MQGPNAKGVHAVRARLFCGNGLGRIGLNGKDGLWQKQGAIVKEWKMLVLRGFIRYNVAEYTHGVGPGADAAAHGKGSGTYMKRAMAVLIALILALGCVLAVGRLYALWQDGPEGMQAPEETVGNVTPEGGEVSADEEEELDYLDLLIAEEEKAMEVQGTFRYEVKDGDYSVTPGLDPDVMNILLLGSDSRGAVLNAGRTDSMIICSVNMKTGQVKLSSIVRDLYVQMPGMKSKNRINAANAFGGPNMAVKCVNEALGLNIERYVSLNFKAFKELVDVLGGVELELSQAEAREVTKRSGVATQAGVQHLNGAQALQYCRIRKLDNNFGRNERQRKFLSAMAAKLLADARLDQALVLAQAALKYVSTNLSTSEVVDLLITAVPHMTGMEMYSCPGQGEYHYENVNDSSVVVGNMDKVRASLHAFIYGDGEE